MAGAKRAKAKSNRRHDFLVSPNNSQHPRLPQLDGTGKKKASGGHQDGLKLMTGNRKPARSGLGQRSTLFDGLRARRVGWSAASALPRIQLPIKSGRYDRLARS